MQPLKSKRLMDVKIVSQLKQVDNWLRVPKLVLKDWSCVIGKNPAKSCLLSPRLAETSSGLVRAMLIETLKRFSGSRFGGVASNAFAVVLIDGHTGRLGNLLGAGLLMPSFV